MTLSLQAFTGFAEVDSIQVVPLEKIPTWFIGFLYYFLPLGFAPLWPQLNAPPYVAFHPTNGLEYHVT